MSDSIVILPVIPDWAESFRSCLDQVAREQKYFLMTEAPPLEKVRDFLLKINTAGHPHYCAMRGSEIVGWCNVKRNETPSRHHVGELSMGVHPDFRGQGLGRKLVQACLRECRLLNFERIELIVFSDNEGALHLYESFGFEIEGHLKDFARINGESKEALAMSLAL